MILDFDGLPAGQPQPGIVTRRQDFDQMTVLLYEFAPQAAFPLHHHPEEQLVVVLSGGCTFTVGERQVALTAGQACRVPPLVPHGCVAGPAGCRFLNILAPRRSGAGISWPPRRPGESPGPG